MGELRKTLAQLSVPDSARYGTQDFRRGHAKDMQKSHQPLAVICSRGDWSVSSRGTGALPYLDRCELEQDIALEIAIDSEDEQWIDWVFSADSPAYILTLLRSRLNKLASN